LRKGYRRSRDVLPGAGMTKENKMPQRISQVDAFTEKPFAGNPAAVCILAHAADDAWMRDVAREMNLSETAFLKKRDDGGYDLRWFTPAVEVVLCGHATLASAHVLWEDGHLNPDAQARFHTKSGVLTAKRRGDWIEMDFPTVPEEPAPAPPELVQALGARPQYAGKNKFDYLIEVASEAEVRALKPDHAQLRQIPARGVMVTSRASSENFDFVSRFFAPGSGIDEDPVTGSAHCCLAPYWAKKLTKSHLLAYQASLRGGTVRMQVEGNRVKLAGHAITVLRGELL
jgi:PhzF family phenazine biosynthesis protein